MYDIYSNAQADAWRFTLGKAGKRILLTVGLNPSTATSEKSDPTVARVQQIAGDNGFDGFVMLNLYPVRGTNFRKLPSEVDTVAFTLNLERIDSVVAAEKRPTVWAAWGDSILHHTFFVDACIELFVRLGKYDVNWLHVGDMTLLGHPRHPSRARYAWSFAPLAVESYISELRPLTARRNGRA